MDRKKILLFLLVLVVVGSIYYLEQTKVSPAAQQTTQEQQADTNSGQYPLAPELAGIVGYINAPEGLQIEDLRGKVVLIDFWTYTCINCIRTLPFLTSWDEKYRDQGLVIIGVHTPEFAFEKKRENVEAAMEKHGIKYAVVQDNDYATWGAYRNRFWPRKYLIDAQGYVRYDHIGEGAYEETEAKIKELLAEIGSDVKDVELTQEQLKERKPITPELYAGYQFALPRGQNVGNEQGMQPGQSIEYSLPLERESNVVYLDGVWMSNADNLRSLGEESTIALDFIASSVNIVYEQANNIEVDVFIDGSYVSSEQAGSDVQFDGERAFIVVNEPQLYNIFEGAYGSYQLELKAKESDIAFNAFTFG